jgi:hypothetical protein
VLELDGQPHLAFFARQTIRIGQELTYDYRFKEEDNKLPCQMRSPRLPRLPKIDRPNPFTAVILKCKVISLNHDEPPHSVSLNVFFNQCMPFNHDQ